MKTKSLLMPSVERRGARTGPSRGVHSASSLLQTLPQRSGGPTQPLLVMQQSIGNRAVQRFLVQRNGSVPLKETQEAAGPTPEEQEKLAKTFAGQLKGEKPETKSQGDKIVKAALKAGLKTETAKKVLRRTFKGKAKVAAQLFTVSGSLALWLAKKTDTLTTPDIPLGKRISISAEYKGSRKRPKSVMVFVKVRW